MIAQIKGLAKPSMSIPPMESPAVCLVSIEVNYFTVTTDCSCLVIIIDRRGYASVNIVIGVVAVGFFSAVSIKARYSKI